MPVPSVVTATENEKVAVTVLLAFMSTVHVIPLLFVQPVHEIKRSPVPGCAVSTTLSPKRAGNWQVSAQPEVPTVTEPSPFTTAVRVSGFFSNTALTVSALPAGVMPHTLVVVPSHASPQLARCEPVAGVAVNVTGLA